MSKKVYALVVGVVGAAGSIASAVVTYCCEPATAAAVNAAIVIAVAAVAEICNLFVKKED